MRIHPLASSLCTVRHNKGAGGTPVSNDVSNSSAVWPHVSMKCLRTTLHRITPITPIPSENSPMKLNRLSSHTQAAINEASHTNGPYFMHRMRVSWIAVTSLIEHQMKGVPSVTTPAILPSCCLDKNFKAYRATLPP